MRISPEMTSSAASASPFASARPAAVTSAIVFWPRSSIAADKSSSCFKYFERGTNIS